LKDGIPGALEEERREREKERRGEKRKFEA